jgi:DNA-binding GntR family transcriptional regulator
VTNDVLAENPRDLRRAGSSIEDVLDYVREGMRQGRLVPGQRLAEPDLMQRLSVSRGTVREALVHLRAEGLVEFERYRGARIRILSRQKVIELNQIRGVIEGLAARLVAEKLDKTGRERLVAIHDSFDQVSGDYLGYNEQFHNTIIELSGNASLGPVIATTLLETFRVQFHSLLSRPAAIKRSYKEHTGILRAILKGDAEEAERRMIRHVEGSCREILDAPDHYFM